MDQDTLKNYMIEPTIAVVDELLDRTSDEQRRSLSDETTFPLVPFPFFEKSRLSEDIGVDDEWIGYWLDTDLTGVIDKRYQAIEWLRGEHLVEFAKSPVVNFQAGIFDGDSYEVKIVDRAKLSKLRDDLQKQKNSVAASKPDEVKIPHRNEPPTRINIGRQRISDKTRDRHIASITCVINGAIETTFQAIVNNDFGNPIKVKKIEGSGKLLHRYLFDPPIPYHTGNPSEPSPWIDALDYINHNTRNILYAGTGCKLTTVFEERDGYVVPIIPIKKISRLAFARKVNQLNKT